jgi:hypothetical protein
VALTLEELGRSQVRSSRRQRIGVLNRRLGWAILPLVITAVSLHYIPDGDTGWHNTVVRVLQFTFVPLMLVHVALSVYVFGLLKPLRTLRVFHVWFGYGYMFLVLASQTTFGIEPLHLILTTAMFACLAAHVGIGVYYASRRHQAHIGRTALEL